MTYFYKTTNLINHKFYYGVHSTDNLEDSYLGSGLAIKYAIKKYGKENFKKEILKYFQTSKDAFEYEEKVVGQELLKDPSCYNLKQGGVGNHRHSEESKQKLRKPYGPMSEEHKQKLANSLRGKKRTEETREKMRKPKSEEHKQKMKKPHGPMPEEHKQKHRKPLSEEHKQKLRKPHGLLEYI